MPATKSQPSPRSRAEPITQTSDRSIATLGSKSSRKESQKRPRSQSRKLSKTNAPSYRNSEKPDSIPPVPALPQQRQNELNEKGGLNKSNQLANPPADRGDVPSYYFQNPMSATSIQPEKFTVVKEPPTLHNKRSANDQGVLRKKSSKRKKDDHTREQEIKAMSSPIPIPKRPQSYQTDMLARDNKSVPGGLNRRLERPLSNVSLPLPESMTSQLSLSQDQHAFKVNSFAALSPRPTIRYSGNPQSPSASTGPSRTSTRKDKQPAILEDDEPLEKSRRRIDDLADDMDAGSLRELMDRDRRRHEKRRQSENERLQRKLQRRSEKQRLKEAAAAAEQSASGDAVGPSQERNVEPTAGSPTAPTKDDGVKTPESWLKDPSRERLVEDPFHDPVAGASTSHFEGATPVDEREEPILETAKAVRLSSASMSPPTSPTRQGNDTKLFQQPSNLSQFSDIDKSTTPDIPETYEVDHRQGSDTGGRLSTSWKSIFRRSDTRAKRGSTDRGRSERGRHTPSEFSNTSKESVTRPPPPTATRVPRVRSGTPIRSHSIFKEDLPEFPTPPDSRMQSPENDPSPLRAIPGSRGTDIVGSTEQPLSEIHPAYREEVALSRNASIRAKSPEEPQSATLSESLASVDAEGSWLTGKPVKRTSTPQPFRESQRMDENLDSDDDGPGTPEAERYMGSLTPARSRSVRRNEDPLNEEPPRVPERRRPEMSRLGSDNDGQFHPAPLVADPEEGTTWHSAVGKHPTIVRQGPGKPKSREGLLNDFHSAAFEESQQSSPSDESPVSPEGPQIQRATSVDMKGHARHISAGSARLLDLPARNSVDFKRLSSASYASGERSPLAQNPRLPGTKDDDLN